ncbi:MAG TPA: PIG-L family deacetylase [Thermoanaerobaculia bacterium]|jgi:LmbE family N-acetylglucosaminyl deacetylase
MLIEAETIPYEPAMLRGERLLVLAPHPDDEVIACGGLVAQHLRDGRTVRIVVATDGGQAGDAALREDETRAGVALLGKADLEFLRFPDRALSDDVIPRLREQLTVFRPDLILVPSPIEIHPDHLALSRAFCALIQQDETLFADFAATRVAFYEVSQTLRPNALVDITEVAELKWSAIGAHASQTSLRDYASFARGLNAYRAMTLPPETRFAEGYYVVELPLLRTTPFSALRTMTGAPPAIEVTHEVLPISVIIRTKDRPALLRDAIDSVRSGGYPCEIVVVNDGGAKPPVDGFAFVDHEESRGRSEAANAGVRAAVNPFVAFLDDDDLFYPEHLATLANAARGSQHAAWYSDAVSAFLRPGSSGAYETHSRLRIYGQDFDRELLLVDNYIPLPTLLIPRDTFLDAGGFDPAFDLFEDWDFLIRLSRRGDFVHVPRVTCEVRHFEGGASIVLAAPEGSPRFRKAKLQVWARHADLIDHDVFANVLERQKRRANTFASDAVAARGEVSVMQRDVDRLEREKRELIAKLEESHHAINGHVLRIRELEGAAASLQAIAADYAERTLLLADRERELRELRGLHRETDAALNAARVEIERLGGLLDMIYASKTWQLHNTLLKLRGRG